MHAPAGGPLERHDRPGSRGVATSRAHDVADIDLVLLSSKKVADLANNLVVTAVDGGQSVLQNELAGHAMAEFDELLSTWAWT